MHAYMYKYAQTHKHTNTQTHKHTNTQTHKHTNTHTESLASSILYCIVLYCIVLHCIVLYVLHCLYRMVMYCMYCMAWYVLYYCTAAAVGAAKVFSSTQTRPMARLGTIRSGDQPSTLGPCANSSQIAGEWSQQWKKCWGAVAAIGTPTAPRSPRLAATAPPLPSSTPP